ncbi:MAG: MBL fold metallo-hydrolase [Candidatus Methanomethylicus sp.]|nr:MBL fold metallo-hydrolase [Candidatus Methanomethylicus sp.]
MIIRQIKKWGDNFAYVIADEVTLEGAAIDPGFNSGEVIKVVNKDGIKIKYVIATHHHMDHIMGIGKIKKEFGALVVAYKSSKIKRDVAVGDGDELSIGNTAIKVIHTPGHTKDGICLLVRGALFTGDTLFVGECGRTDLGDGSPEEMHHSLFGKLMALDDSVLVYPGHDYGKSPFSTIGEEKVSNYTLRKRTLEEFVAFMKEP